MAELGRRYLVAALYLLLLAPLLGAWPGLTLALVLLATVHQPSLSTSFLLSPPAPRSSALQCKASPASLRCPGPPRTQSAQERPEEQEDREVALPWWHPAPHSSPFSPCSISSPFPLSAPGSLLVLGLLGFWFWMANLAWRATREIRCCLGEPAPTAGAVVGRTAGAGVLAGGCALMGLGVAVMSSPAAVFLAGTRGLGEGAMVVTERVSRGLVLVMATLLLPGPDLVCRELRTVLAKVVGLGVEPGAGVLAVGTVVETLAATVDWLAGALLGLAVVRAAGLDGVADWTWLGFAAETATLAVTANCIAGFGVGLDLSVATSFLAVARQTTAGLTLLHLTFAFLVFACPAGSSDFLDFFSGVTSGVADTTPASPTASTNTWVRMSTTVSVTGLVASFSCSLSDFSCSDSCSSLVRLQEEVWGLYSLSRPGPTCSRRHSCH